MVDFKKVLAGANKKWATAKKRAAESEPAFTEYPDGKYEAKLVGAKLGVSDGGRNQIAFSWKFMDGEYEGKTKVAYQGIDTEDNLYYLARDLERLGYELPDNLGDLPDILKDIEKSKPVGSINLKTKGDFQNVYIRKVYTADEEEEGDDTEDEDTAESDEVDETEETEEEESDDAEESDEEETDEESDEESGDEESDDEEESDEESDEEESDEESDEEDAEEVEVEVGMRVIAETAKGREPGKIIKILEDEGMVRVKLDNEKIVRVAPDKIEIEPEKKKTPAKPKAAPKPAAKKAASAPAKKAGKPAAKSAPKKVNKKK